MKHCCKRLLQGSLFALLTLPAALRADVIIMKDGKKYEDAKVISETPETVTFSYVFLKKFPDKRTEPKSAIAQIVTQKPEEVDVIPLLKVVPTADLLSADKYESLIQDTLRPFVNKYPGTPQAKQVEDIIKTLQEEKEKVVGGSVKMEGKWISAEEAKRDTHSIDAYRVRRDVKDLAAEGKFREALNEWQKMNDPDDGFTDTLQYVKAVPEVLAILDAYKKQLDGMLSAAPDLVKRRKENIAKMVDIDPNKARTERAVKDEEQKFLDELNIQKLKKEHWLSVYKYDDKTISSAEKAVIDESTRLRVLDLQKLSAQNEALVAARQFLADGNIEPAEAALKRASAVPGLHTTSKAIQNLTKELNALKSEQAKKRQAQKIYGTGNVGAITTASNAGGTDARVAEAIAKAEKEKAEKKEGKGADSPATAEDGKDKPDADSGKKSAAAEKKDKKEKEKKEKEKKKHTPSTSTDDTASKPSEDEGGIQGYLLPAGGGLLALLVAFLFFQKRKKE